jgi:hypothetical protein
MSKVDTPAVASVRTDGVAGVNVDSNPLDAASWSRIWQRSDDVDRKARVRRSYAASYPLMRWSLTLRREPGAWMTTKRPAFCADLHSWTAGCPPVKAPNQEVLGLAQLYSLQACTVQWQTSRAAARAAYFDPNKASLANPGLMFERSANLWRFAWVSPNRSRVRI